MLIAALCLLHLSSQTTSAASDATEQQLLQAAREQQDYMVGVRRCSAVSGRRHAWPCQVAVRHVCRLDG